MINYKLKNLLKEEVPKFWKLWDLHICFCANFTHLAYQKKKKKKTQERYNLSAPRQSRHFYTSFWWFYPNTCASKSKALFAEALQHEVTLVSYKDWRQQREEYSNPLYHEHNIEIGFEVYLQLFVATIGNGNRCCSTNNSKSCIHIFSLPAVKPCWHCTNFACTTPFNTIDPGI